MTVFLLKAPQQLVTGNAELDHFESYDPFRALLFGLIDVCRCH
jgi:hypothetical protein